MKLSQKNIINDFVEDLNGKIEYVSVSDKNTIKRQIIITYDEKRNINQLSNAQKLESFPSINFISIDESEQRRNLLLKKFEENGLTNITSHIFKRYSDDDHTLIADNLDNFVGPGRGPVTSHLKAIKEWYYNTDEEYTFFCEDDLSFETVSYWNFTWKEFFESLPSTWECVQLCWVRDNLFAYSLNGVTLRPRFWCDWSGCAYLIRRCHAKKLIESYHQNEEFTLNYAGIDAHLRAGVSVEIFLRPIIETIIFTRFSDDNQSICSFPLFVEDVLNCKSTLFDGSAVNYNSYITMIDWWKTTGKNATIEQISSFTQ